MSLKNIQKGVSIVFQREKILEKEVTELFGLFRWMESRKGKDFRRYLASPFFVGETELKVLPALFDKLYERFNTGSSRINGSSLIKDKNLGLTGKPLNETRRFLRKRIGQIRNCLLDFFAQQQLGANPRFRHFLAADFFQARKEPEWSRRNFMEWQEAIDDLPLSFEKARAGWQLLQKYYFSFSTEKDPEAGYLLEALCRRFGLFADIHRLLYQIESDNRGRLFQPPAPDKAPVQEILKGEPERYRRLELLKNLLEQLLALLSAKNFNKTQYEYFKGSFLEHYDSLDLYLQLMAVHLLKNYLYRNARRGHAETARENFFWARFQVENGLLLFNDEFTETTFLNIATVAASNGEIGFLKQFRQDYLRCLPEHQQPKVDKLVEIMAHFYGEDYEAVIDYIQSHFSRKQPKDYHYHLRIKSYRLRSALVLYVRGAPGFEDEFDKAYDDLEKFLERHKASLSPEAITPFQNCKKLAYRIARAKFKLKLTEETDRLISRAGKYKELQGKLWFIAQLKKGFK